MIRKLSLALAVSLAFAPSGASALGLGAISGKSSLNETFMADIPLVLANQNDVEDVKANLASAADFQRAGVDRSYLLTKLQFHALVREDGTSVIRVTSKEPIREPYLDFLVEVNWPKGRLVREFTVLLDPPDKKKPQPAPPATAVAAAPAPAVIAPVAKPAPAPAPAPAPTPALAPPPAPAPVEPKTGSVPYGPVKPGVSLSKLVKELHIPGISKDKLAKQIFQDNPSAFSNGDINRLRQGAMLRVPSATPPVGERTPPVTPAVEKPVVAVPPPEVVAQPVKPVAPPPAPPVPPPLDTKPIPEPAAPVAIKEPLPPVTPEVKPGIPVMPDVPPVTPVAPVTPDIKVEQPPPAPVAEPAIPPPVKAGVPEQPPVVTPQPEPQVAPPPVAGEPVTPPAPAPSFLGGLLADPTMMGIAGGSAVVLLSLVWLLMRRRREAEQPFQEGGVGTEALAMTESGDLKPDSRKRVPDGDESSFISDFTPSDIDALQDETGEVDPAAEADVYIAYGRYQQAEALIQQAIEKQPERSELRVKLLEIYFTTRNKESFTSQAEELHRADGGQPDSQLWRRVVSMGQELVPGHPLFQSLPGAASRLQRQSELSGMPPASFAAVTAPVSLDKSQGSPVSAPLVNSEFLRDLDLNLDFDTAFANLDSDGATPVEVTPARAGTLPPDTSAEPASEPLFSFDEESELSISLGDLATLEDVEENTRSSAKETSLTLEDVSPATQAIHDSALLEWTLDDLGGNPLEAEDDPTALRLDDFQLEESALTPVSQPLSDLLRDSSSSDEVETKLDLARAYMEMGDSEGAKEILDEVLRDGNEIQKVEARRLIKEAS